MPGSEQVLRKSYRNAANVQVGKFTVAKVDTSVYADGFVMSSTANDGPLVGVALESIIPDGYSDYSSGKYIIASGAAWPSGVTPTAATGYAASFGVKGIFRAIANGVITRGQRVNLAASATINGVTMYGTVKQVSETPGTLIYVLGTAEDSVSNAGDVVRVRVEPGVAYS